MRRVCVFCGSRSGLGDVYLEAARQLGRTLAEHGVELVYGGAAVGTMGALADAALQAGGRVIGVMPKSLVEREIAHPGLHALHIVDSMHARKAQMTAMSDGFIALPGGVGTLEELFEVLTGEYLGLHHKPTVLLNIDAFWEPLLRFVAHAGRAGFVSESQQRQIRLARHASEALAILRAPRAVSGAVEPAPA